MKKLLMISAVLLSLVFSANSLAFEIDISNSSFEVINSQQFKVRQVLATGYPGTYWADFLWDPDQLLFQPTAAGEETSITSPKSGIAVVGKGDGYYPDPIAAMNDIASWCGTPSETNPCLVKILPGVYDLGITSLEMKPYVDIEGSGENVTKIQGQGDYEVVSGSSSAEIRSVTVEHTGGADRSVAIAGAPTMKLTNLTAISTKGTGTNYCVYYQSINLESPRTPPLEIRNSTLISAEGKESVGVEHGYAAGTIIIRNSSIVGTTNSVRNSRGSTLIANTRLIGPVGGTGLTTCAGVYDENFTFYANTCP